jgi:hypothetical protein
MDNTAPRPVDPASLYDGPDPANVQQFPGAPRFAFTPEKTEKQDARSRPDYVATITAGLDVLGARLLGLIATIAACALWGFSVYEPELLRTYAALGFSITVLLPLVALYYRRG